MEMSTTSSGAGAGADGASAGGDAASAVPVVDAKQVEVVDSSEPLLGQGGAQVAPVAQEFWEGIHRTPQIAELPTDQTERFNIEGGDLSQVLMVKLAPGEVITTEPYSMMMMSDGVGPKVDYGSCGQGCTRCCCAGENFFRLQLCNNNSTEAFVGITPCGPGSIVPIDLRKYSGLRFSRGAFLAAYGTDWRMTIKRAGGVATMCCGGQGLFLNELEGSAMAFITGVGCIEQVHLAPGQKYVVDQESVLAFEKTVHFDVRGYGCSLVCCCGGFGLFQTVLEGPGLVLVQSLPLGKFKRAVGGGGGGGNNNNNGDGGGGN